jgi:DDE superfamily endonuclease
MTSSRGGKKTWCVGAIDADYTARMEEVLATYERPLRAEEPVVCLDERPVQLTADTRPPTRARPGRQARCDYEYKRHGTANLFCAVEPKAGWHLVRATPNRTGPEFAKVIRAITAHYPAADTIHLVMDNLSTHTRKSLTDYYGQEAGGTLWDRLMVHYTPKHASWHLGQCPKSRRDRHRPAGPRMPGQAADRGPAIAAERNPRLDAPGQPPAAHHPMAVHPPQSPQGLRLPLPRSHDEPKRLHQTPSAKTNLQPVRGLVV